MHEFSVVQRLLAQVESLVDSEADCVAEIEIRIGPLSGVESLLVQSAFESLRSESCACDASLTIRETPLIAVCVDCDQKNDIEDFIFRCHHCQSQDLQVIDGDKIELVSVTVNQESA